MTLFLFFVIASLGIYGLIFTGLAARSKYTTLGSIRAIAQFISYEIFLSLVFLPLIVLSGSADISVI